MDNSSVDQIFQIVRTGNVESLQAHLAEKMHNTNINSTRWSGFSLLHRAAGLGNTDMCEILLQHGADINLRSIRGWYTPLHIALANGYIETGMFLISAGARPWIKSKYNEDPFDYGAKRGFKKLVDEFRGKIVKMEMTENLKRHRELLARQKSSDNTTNSVSSSIT